MTIDGVAYTQGQRWSRYDESEPLPESVVIAAVVTRAQAEKSREEGKDQ